MSPELGCSFHFSPLFYFYCGQGASLLEFGVPFTVCSSGRISDAAADAFSRGFYDALASGRGPERCFVEVKILTKD